MLKDIWKLRSFGLFMGYSPIAIRNKNLQITTAAERVNLAQDNPSILELGEVLRHNNNLVALGPVDAGS